MSDYLESGVFYREPAWHGKGTVVQEVMNAREAVKLAGLDWQVALMPVTYAGMDIPGYSATVRLDTNRVLGIVSDRYKIIQNRDMFSFFDPVVDHDEGRFFHTAGSLKGGKVVWALAKVPGDFYVVKDDRVENYLLLASSHDGSMHLIAKHTAIRVVCWNTLSLALDTKSPVTVSIRHTTGAMDALAQAHRALGLATRRVGIFETIADQMRRYQMTSKGVRSFLEKLLPATPNPKTGRPPAQTMAKREEIELLFADAPTNNLPGMQGSAWAMYNAVAEYVDHDWPARTGTDTLHRSWFGTGEDVKRKAHHLILQQINGNWED